MRPGVAKVVVAVILALAGSGAAVYLGYRVSNTPKPAALVAVTRSSEIHTADWYVAHPDVLHQDEQRCAGDAATIAPAACQNAFNADARLAAIEFQKAAAAAGAAAKADAARTNSKPR
jgi:hypothetical protein